MTYSLHNVCKGAGGRGKSAASCAAGSNYWGRDIDNSGVNMIEYRRI